MIIYMFICLRCLGGRALPWYFCKMQTGRGRGFKSEKKFIFRGNSRRRLHWKNTPVWLSWL